MENISKEEIENEMARQIVKALNLIGVNNFMGAFYNKDNQECNIYKDVKIENVQMYGVKLLQEVGAVIERQKHLSESNYAADSDRERETNR